MFAVKGYYRNSTITLLEPLPAEIQEAELNIVVLPKDPEEEGNLPSSEEKFEAIGMAAFFDTDDDANVDWGDCFGLK